MLIFIIGNGRTGTHFIAELINSSGEFEYNGEEEPVFSYSCNYNILGKNAFRERLLSFYKNKTHYIDKCHPNLWCAEEILKRFPHAIFICTERNREDIIKSMTKHPGCTSWFTHKETPFPNKYLGIKNRQELDGAIIRELCNKRCLAHESEIERLKKSNFPAFYFNYDDRFNDAKRLEKYLNLTFNKTLIK